MTSKKVFYAMVASVALMIGIVIGSVILGDTLLKKQSDKLVNLKADAAVIEAQQQSLRQAKKDVEKYAELGEIAKQVVPQDKDQARAVREIVSIAEQSRIAIASVTFPSSNLGQKTSAGSGSATTTPLSQAKPVSGIEGLYQLDIAIVSDAAQPTTYNRLISFLERLEQNRRTAQVSQISIQPDSQNRSNLNFTLTVTVYIKP